MQPPSKEDLAKDLSRSLTDYFGEFFDLEPEIVVRDNEISANGTKIMVKNPKTRSANLPYLPAGTYVALVDHDTMLEVEQELLLLSITFFVAVQSDGSTAPTISLRSAWPHAELWQQHYPACRRYRLTLKGSDPLGDPRYGLSGRSSVR